MKTLNITAKDLVDMGFPQSSAIPEILAAIATYESLEGGAPVADKLRLLLDNPGLLAEDNIFGKAALKLLPAESDVIKLRQDAPGYKVFGSEFIEEGAKQQMATAMRLPVAVAGALMPDAHQGYGLPIGGVLATDNVVMPYGVGVDIGCRMCLSIYDIPAEHFDTTSAQYKRELIAHTKFGAGSVWQGVNRADHEVLTRTEFKSIPIVKSLHDKAYAQLGTSGGGNHFVEWGIIEMLADSNPLNIPAGKYLALLSHSGSRGLGATIANHYTKLAKELCKLPKEAANLAYLDLDTQAGQEYWLAMNLAGDYASACHAVIHERLTRAIGGNLLARVENHHNFAWKEMLNGKEVIVHRKGATPATQDVLGIIPGSMASPGFLVKGRGDIASINSASHGAGRQMSRTKANQTFNRHELRDLLKLKNITLIGGGLDEAPGAYKDINAVMNAQTDLVDTLAKFTPRMVRMADDGSRED